MKLFSVIIPYYQEREGILQRALTSLLQQNLPAETYVDIIIVDDGSPLPLEKEISNLIVNSPFRLITATQKNQGVAAARNAALSRMRAETDFVAFLDSDDIWDKDYLKIACEAFDNGADFFFCDTERVGDLHTCFEEKKFGAFLESTGTKQADDNLYELDKESFLYQSLKGRAFRISGAVYKKAIAPDLIFNVSLRSAGEDCLFLLQIILKSTRIFCTSLLLVVFGDGVNIYAGNYGWDNPANLTRIMGLLMTFYAWQTYLPLSASNQHLVSQRIKAVRKLFAFMTIRYLVKHPGRWPEKLRSLIETDRSFWLWYPLNILYVMVCYPLKLYSPLAEW